MRQSPSTVSTTNLERRASTTMRTTAVLRCQHQEVHSDHHLKQSTGDSSRLMTRRLAKVALRGNRPDHRKTVFKHRVLRSQLKVNERKYHRATAKAKDPRVLEVNKATEDLLLKVNEHRATLRANEVKVLELSLIHI